MSSNSYQVIWDTVARIPYGRVATYGQIARVAGLGRRARLAGYALHNTPDGVSVPWHRVVNAQGRISLPPGSDSHARQRRLLEAEGIVFINGRLDLSVYRWEPDADEWPPEYLEPERA